MMAPEIKSAIQGTIALIVMGAIIFYIAGTIDYWQGWLTLGVMLCGGVLVSSVVMRDRELLERRMNFKEATASHMAVQYLVIAALLFAAIFPPLDHHFGWSSVPKALNILGALVTLLAYVTLYLVLRENRYASATIQVAQDQPVISSGIYAYVRHPWYVGLLLLFAGLPLALGSYWGLLVILPMLATLIWRLVSEERFLTEHLVGYSDYLRKVRWRLLPGVF